MWSDGAGHQFKNRFSFWWLLTKITWHVIIEWNFYATCHGKNPSDQAGGHVKVLLYGYEEAHNKARDRRGMLKYLNDTMAITSRVPNKAFQVKICNICRKLFITSILIISHIYM